MLTIQRRSENAFFYAVGRMGGERIRRSLKTKDRSLAKKRLKELEHTLLHGDGLSLLPRKPFGGTAITLGYVIREYARSRATGKGDTAKYYLKRLDKRVGHVPVRSFREAQWEAYVNRFLSDVSDSSVRREGRQLSAVLSYANRMGWCDPVKLALPADSPPSEVFIEPEEFDAVVRHLEAEDPDFLRVVLFLRYTGARPIELRRLRRQDVYLDPSLSGMGAIPQNVVRGHVTLRWRKGKGSVERQRNVPLHPKAAEAIGLPHYACRGEEPVFIDLGGKPWSPNSIAAAWAKARKAAGIREEVGLYALRHAFGTELGARNVPIRTIADLMGHTSPSMTMRYVKSRREDHEAAILKL